MKISLRERKLCCWEKRYLNLVYPQPTSSVSHAYHLERLADVAAGPGEEIAKVYQI